MGNYLVKPFFIILSKIVVNRNMLYILAQFWGFINKKHGCMVIIYYIPIKHDYNDFMLDKLVLMHCRNYVVNHDR